MDNICVDVYVPGINKSYDIVIAPYLTVVAAAEYIFKTVNEYEALEIKNDEHILCSLREKKVLDGRLTLKESGVLEAERLILL